MDKELLETMIEETQEIGAAKKAKKTKKNTQRYMQMLGENLQDITKKLMANQNLLRYLVYTDKDPLSTEHPNLVGADVYNKQLLIIPVIGTNEDAMSKITLKILRGTTNPNNSEFIEAYFNIEVFVPLTQWIIKSDNLRPYLIMGEIMRSLEGKSVQGLGEIVFDSFEINFLSEEMSCYQMTFHFTQFK